MMQSPQVVTLKSGQQNASSVESKSPTHAFELGRVTVFEVLAERRRYLDVERAWTEALRAAYEARTALNLALGEKR